LRRIRGKPIPELEEWAFLFYPDWKVLKEAFRVSDGDDGKLSWPLAP
jgi:hypothetical protein